MSTVDHAVISAAGMGTRLGMNLPKCLVEIEGRALIDYQLDALADIENVRVVVGFMETEVIRHVAAVRSDVVFVRNPHYHSTSNTRSLFLGSRGIGKPFLSIDGDLIFSENTVRTVLASYDGAASVVGITERASTEAVGADVNSETGQVVAFGGSSSDYEWSGIALFSGIDVPDDDDGYVYRILERHLPLPAVRVESLEVDTPDDLRRVRDRVHELTFKLA